MHRYGGANSIIEAGRQESQRLLMERYRRIDVNDQHAEQIGGGGKRPPKFVNPHNHNYYSNGGSGQPPSVYPDSSRQYIPMS